jgi:hypothetical protein
VIAACRFDEQSARSRRQSDCGRVLEYLGTPQELKEGGHVFDPRWLEKPFKDPNIRAAMNDLFASGWTWQSPANDPRPTKVRKLCGVE